MSDRFSWCGCEFGRTAKAAGTSKSPPSLHHFVLRTQILGTRKHSFVIRYLEGSIFPALGGLDRILVDLVVVVGLGPAGVGAGADHRDKDDEHQDDDEEVLRLRQLRVGDTRDAQARDDDRYDLKENYL